VVRCQDPTDGRFYPHPSLRMRSHPPTNLRAINFGPASRSWFSGPVKTKYGIGFRWKLTPPFQVPSTTFIQPSWSLFQHIPLSAVLQYIFIILFTFIDLFHKVYSHYTFTFLSLPQYLASIVIFTDWGKQGVTKKSNMKNIHIKQQNFHVIMYHKY
jgi:hypothetical protein